MKSIALLIILIIPACQTVDLSSGYPVIPGLDPSAIKNYFHCFLTNINTRKYSGTSTDTIWSSVL